MEKTKVIVTGGAGFIGSHLCETLVSMGKFDIVSIDNYSTGSVENHVEGVRYIKGEAADIGTLFDPEDNISMVFHLGEYSRVEQSFDDIETVFKSNTYSILSIVSFCKKMNAKLIYAGSSTKFADGGIGPQQSPYAWSKATNTGFINSYAQWYGINYAIVYFYNVYGGREIKSGKYATVIGKFTELYKQGKDIPVVCPGNQKRNFTHIRDIINGLILVGLNGNGDGYGIGNPKSYTILEVAKMFGNTIVMLPSRPGNRMTADVHTDKTTELGWKPTVELDEYINEIVYK